ncbi:MAG: hypothetical protein ACXACF_07235, partial [Candidatus Hermodarchaeia archaeon]
MHEKIVLVLCRSERHSPTQRVYPLVDIQITVSELLGVWEEHESRRTTHSYHLHRRFSISESACLAHLNLAINWHAKVYERDT